MSTLRGLQNAWLWGFLFALIALQIFREYLLAGINSPETLSQSVLYVLEIIRDWVKQNADFPVVS